jgi:hypothetical protein
MREIRRITLGVIQERTGLGTHERSKGRAEFHHPIVREAESHPDYPDSHRHYAPGVSQIYQPGLSYARPGLSCDRSGLSYARSGLSYARPGLSYARSGLSYARSGLSCVRSGSSCDLVGDSSEASAMPNSL